MKGTKKKLFDSQQNFKLNPWAFYNVYYYKLQLTSTPSLMKRKND